MVVLSVKSISVVFVIAKKFNNLLLTQSLQKNTFFTVDFALEIKPCLMML